MYAPPLLLSSRGLPLKFDLTYEFIIGGDNGRRISIYTTNDKAKVNARATTEIMVSQTVQVFRV
jgi:hypothetical protein